MNMNPNTNTNTNTKNMKTNTNTNTITPRQSGFTLLEIMIVVSIIALLAVIAIPQFVRARSTAQQNSCINNLRQIQSAISQYALEKKASGTTPVQFSDIEPYLRGSVLCPAGGATFDDGYDISDVQTPPVCKNVPTGPNAHVQVSGPTP